eukprot:scaffold29981_cov101-Isochrysis_galbana.AAC.1
MLKERFEGEGVGARKRALSTGAPHAGTHWLLGLKKTFGFHSVRSSPAGPGKHKKTRPKE